jgi:hypothetical protein
MTTTKVNLANTVEGILPVANGGTGTSTGVAPGGSTTQVQYNNAGAFGGDSGFVYTGGNVGIGVSSPAAKLHVSGTYGTTATGGVRLVGIGQTTGDLSPIAFYLQSSSWGTAHQATITAQQVSGTDSGANILFSTSTTGQFAPTERMRIDSSGNVGIGTSSITANTQVDIVSADASQQFVDVLRLKTTSTGDRHPSILFENNRSSVANALKLCMDSTDSAGTGEFTLRIKDSGGTFNTRLNVSNGGILRFNSGYGSVAAAYGCRAWVNFDGTGTPGIRASGNVSSITDNATGDYTVNFGTAMPDTNYTVVTGGSPFENPPATWNNSDSYSALTTRMGASTSASSVRVLCYRLRFDSTGVAAVDGFANMIAIFR